MEFDPISKINLGPIQLESINLDELKLTDIKLHQINENIDKTPTPVYFHRTSGWTIVLYFIITIFIMYYVVAKLFPKWKKIPNNRGGSSIEQVGGSSIDQVGLQN